MEDRMNRQGLNRIAGTAPIAMSLLALLVVVAALATGSAKGQTDEGAAAHIWQLLMVAQVPLLAVFVATADWARRPRVLLMLALQALAIAAALAPVAYFRL
jgi:hypothetical protein